MNVLALSTALTFTMNLTLCLVVLSSKPRDMAHWVFACFVLSFVTRRFEVSEKALQFLENYSWPGNVRELENCILSAMLLACSNRIEAEDLPSEVRGLQRVSVPRDGEELRRMKWELRPKGETELERVFLLEALKRNRGNISKTALDVGMDRRQLQNLIRKHRILAKKFKAGPL